jgi:hypothetical protein
MSSYGGLSRRTFRCLSVMFMGVMVLVLFEGLEATGAIHSDKNNNGGVKVQPFEIYNLPAIKWACDPFLDVQREIQAKHHQHHNLDNLREKTRDLCMRMRGGRLGDDSSKSDVVVIDGNSAEGTEHSNSSMDERVVAVLETEDEEEDEPETDSLGREPVKSSIHTSTIIRGGAEGATLEDTETKVVNGTEDKATDSPSNYTFSVFQKGDGHEEDPDGIPARYLKMQGDRRDLAKAALENTVKWRAENDVDTILARPHPKFDVSKAVFPHYFCGRDDTQHVILLQRPGLMNVKLAAKNGLSGEELLFHYIYVMEYLWRIIDPTPDATMTSIIDLTEMNISILRKREQLRIGSLFLSTMDAHFPQRSHRTFLINAPKWFGALYKLASPLLRESTKEKIMILSKGQEQDEILRDLLRDCPIPEGTKYEDVPAGLMEEELRDFCLARLDEAGAEMQVVEPV